MARHSRGNFTLGAPERTRPPLIRLACMGEAAESDTPFTVLSFSKGLADMLQERADECLRSDAASIKGRLPPTALIRGSMSRYSTVDSLVKAKSLEWQEPPPWLSRVDSRTKSAVKDSDLAYLETLARENLSILSYMDAFLTAVSTSIVDRKSQSMEDSFVLKTLDLAASGVADLSRRTIVGLHQVVVHRRDTALWGVTVAKGAQIAALRHSPVAQEAYVFPPLLLQQITEKHKEDAKDKLILRAATSASAAPKPFMRPAQTPTPNRKHRASEHVFSPAAKRPKKASTPKPQRKTEATPPASKPAKDFNQFR